MAGVSRRGIRRLTPGRVARVKAGLYAGSCTSAKFVIDTVKADHAGALCRSGNSYSAYGSVRLGTKRKVDKDEGEAGELVVAATTLGSVASAVRV